ncbi:MAG: 50S ribosomal protein L18Ae [Candidatus Thermoplasmatota archaeon]|nr:50S ribosomal protein L18Ae [Candidatus Thermoplasmatota archaeon]
MKAYRVSGEFRMGRNWQPFTLETLADSEEEATEWALSILGSRHRVKRRQVNIEDVHEEDASEIEDPSVKFGAEHEEEYKERKAEEIHG